MRFPHDTDFGRMNAMALVGMSASRLEKTESESVLERIARESAAAASPFADDAALVCEMRANVAVARRL
jgi:hypothetical protein